MLQALCQLCNAICPKICPRVSRSKMPQPSLANIVAAIDAAAVLGVRSVLEPNDLLHGPATTKVDPLHSLALNIPLLSSLSTLLPPPPPPPPLHYRCCCYIAAAAAALPPLLLHCRCRIASHCRCRATGCHATGCIAAAVLVAVVLGGWTVLGAARLGSPWGPCHPECHECFR